MPVLYKCDYSAPSRAVLTTIELLKIHDKFTFIDMDPLKEDIRNGDNMNPEFMKKNPLHSVPVLDDDGLIICDSHVIMTYIVQKYAPGSSLYPNDLKIRSMIDQRMYLESTAMTPKIMTGVDSLRKGLKGITDEQKFAMKETYSFLDCFLEKTEYLATDQLTLADISSCSSLGNMDLFLPIPDEFKNLKKWYSRLEKEDWFQKVNAKGVKLYTEKLKKLFSFEP